MADAPLGTGPTADNDQIPIRLLEIVTPYLQAASIDIPVNSKTRQDPSEKEAAY